MSFRKRKTSVGNGFHPRVTRIVLPRRYRIFDVWAHLAQPLARTRRSLPCLRSRDSTHW